MPTHTMSHTLVSRTDKFIHYHSNDNCLVSLSFTHIRARGEGNPRVPGQKSPTTNPVTNRCHIIPEANQRKKASGDLVQVEGQGTDQRAKEQTGPSESVTVEEEKESKEGGAALTQGVDGASADGAGAAVKVKQLLRDLLVQLHAVTLAAGTRSVRFLATLLQVLHLLRLMEVLLKVLRGTVAESEQLLGQHPGNSRD